MTEWEPETLRALRNAWEGASPPPAPLDQIVARGRRLRRRRRCAAFAISAAAGVAVLTVTGTANGLTPAPAHPAISAEALRSAPWQP